MTGPGDERAGRGRLLASRADREQAIDALKAAFVQGRLTKDEFDARIGQTIAARRYAELAAVTDDIPAVLPGTQLPRRRANNAARWGASGFVTPVILAAAFTFASVRGDGAYAVVAFLVAFAYTMFWLSAGADMLWQWHSMSVPAAGMCVRCAHTKASHRAPATCTVRLGALKMQSRCPCTGYVPPGISPEAADLDLVPGRY